MITIEQIRAARGLIDWSQRILAEKSGISLNSLNNIERGVGRPRSDTLNKIQTAIEEAGVELTVKNGVQMRDNDLEIEKYTGSDIMHRYYQDILDHVSAGTDIVYFTGIDNVRLMARYPDRFDEYRNFEKKLNALEIEQQCVVKEGSSEFLSESNIFRWAPANLFSRISFAIYENNVCIIPNSSDDRLIFIRSGEVAQTFRNQFQHIWALSDAVPDEVFKEAKKK